MMTGKELNIDMENQPFTREGFLRLKQTLRTLVIGVLVLSALALAFGILTIYLVVLAKNNHNEINDLKDQGLTLSSSWIPDEGMSLVGPLFQGTGYWSVRNTLPFKRSDHQAVTVGDEIYVVGGNDADGKATDDISIFDPLLGTFRKGPKIPSVLTRFALAHVRGKPSDKLYLIGGLNDGDGDAIGEVHILDIQSGKWSKGPELITPRSDLCAAVVDDKIYVAGGYSVGYAKTLDSVEVLGIGKGEWQEITNVPTPRGDCKCAQLSGELVVLGGYYDPTGDWASNSFRNEVEAYNPETKSWRELAKLPNARGDKAVVSLPNNRLLVSGGETHHRGQTTGIATHYVEEYLGDHDVWVHKAPLALPRFRTAGAYADGTVFLFGGHAVCQPGEEEGSKDCPETDEIQAFYDTDHPNAFLVEKE